MQRKLTAILSADVVGYSGLMEADEAGTLHRLKDNRTKIFDPQVEAAGGRVFKLMGDGALAEFSSVIAAVTCALAIQEATAAAGDVSIRYRIGINLGEVIVEGDDIYGEGVNVAARLQALAPVGGVAVSGVVRDQVHGKAPVLFEDMGEHTVKNIERPVRVYSARVPPKEDTQDFRVERSKLSVCVLPFANMSGDVEQEYFSDGISEDIITDLSKVSALSIVSRNSSFMYKGKNVDIPKVSRELNVSHVLEGSVRKSGGRVRITAQLIDGVTNDHVWAERYDRDLSDIFALQDEISEAIVKALKLKLLPEEKKAIEARGTDNPEAYNLYLMARQTYSSGFESDMRRNAMVARLSQRAVEIDPGYARAWALLALGQMLHRATLGGGGDGGLAAANQALALDSKLAEAHAVKARILAEQKRRDEAESEIQIALKLDPESYEVNRSAGYLNYTPARLETAARHYEKSMSLMETDINSASMLVSCYTAMGNIPAMQQAARIAIARAENVLAQDPNNSVALGYGAYSLAALKESERSKDWMSRALLIDPDNMNMRYNFACALASFLMDKEAAIDMIAPVLEKMAAGFLLHVAADPDLKLIRDDVRFQTMFSAAETRTAGDLSNSSSSP
ncbi:MAG TPA: adenylate/guanylate cyclase domain-containing protein [Rhizomicrobium sp.]|nr:adenylate/guanylate cyclase domain-containing protein [Rhizomicrobium sp.]